MILAFWLALVAIVRADHNEPPVLTKQLIGVFKVINEQGYSTWAMGCDGNTYPNFRTQVDQVFADEAARVGIPPIEVGLNDNPNIVLCLTYNYPCVSGSAGCVLGLWGPPAVAYFKESLFYADWRTTIGHEWGHAADNQHEMYDDRSFTCLRDRVWTRMSCGTGTWWVTEFDRDITWNTYVPDAPCPRSFAVQDGWVTLSWGAQRCDSGGAHHGNPVNDSATRVAFGWKAPGSDSIVWAGEICGPAFNYCYTPYSAGSRAFDPFWTAPGACFYIRAENPALWHIPQVSAPNYWTWLGCV